MSTKIYTGFKFDTKSWKKVHEWIMNFRTELNQQLYTDACSGCASCCCLDIDQYTLAEDKKIKLPVWKNAMSLWREGVKEHPDKFDLSLFPYKGHIYGMVFADDPYESMWMKKPYVIDFKYFNNQDKPEEITRRDWVHRKRVWDSILKDRPPSMAGFLAKCTEPFPKSPDIKDVLDNMPSFEERVKRIGDERVYQDFLNNHQPSVTPSIDYLHWKQTPDGIAEVSKERDRVIGLLIPEITEKMILAKYFRAS